MKEILKKILLAIISAPFFAVIGIIIITVIGAIDDAISVIQLKGYWWLILIISFFLSLIYFISEEKIKIYYKRKKFVDTLILYYRDQQANKDKIDPSEKEIELLKDMLEERIKIWAWSDPEIWNRYYHEEQFSESLFKMMDNFILYYHKQLEKYS